MKNAKKDLYLYVELTKNCDEKFFICDNTGFGKNGFKLEDEEDEDRYKLSDIVLYTVLVYNASDEKKITSIDFKTFDSEDIIKYNHKYSNIIKSQELELTVDGYYTLYYLAIPKEISFKRQFNYRSDEDGTIYNEDGKEISIYDMTLCKSNVMYYSSDLFSVGNLRKTFLSYVYDNIFKVKNGVLNRIKNKCCNNDLDIYNEVIGSALSAIQYLLEQCKYKEAQIVIEQLSGCGDIYSNNKNLLPKYNGCGCK